MSLPWLKTIISVSVAASCFFCAAVASEEVSPSTPIGDKWAVIIGISKFADPDVPALRYSAKDAQDFYEYLTSHTGGGFAQDHVKISRDETATKANILDAVGDSFLPRAAAPEDLVLVYLSTHGSPAGRDIKGVNYVIAYDTEKKRLFATGINMGVEPVSFISTVPNYVSALKVAREKAVRKAQEEEAARATARAEKTKSASVEGKRSK